MHDLAGKVDMRHERIVTTATGWVVNAGAMREYNEAYALAGDRASALAILYDRASREGWARAAVAAAGESWRTHLAKFDGTVLPRAGDEGMAGLTHEPES